METQHFERDLKDLAGFVGSWQSNELFNTEYLALLEQVKVDTDPARRYGHAKRMKRLLMLQLEFTMNQWLKADRDEDAQ